ncbi:MAG TPA: hypothetical protein VEM13_07735 [Gemmatimonadales bacterium]|nr:hypothetical protein [Gemmatimonadales bacterium]
MNTTHHCRPGVGPQSVAFWAAALALALLPAVAAAQAINDLQRKQKPPTLSDAGSFYVGGRDVTTDASTTGTVNGVPVLTAGSPGDLTVDQLYVQFQVPENAGKHVPVVFVHGCCLSSKTWETTPDGREGWYEYFVRNGHPTYLADQSSRARSGFNATIYNEVRVGLQPPTALPNILMATHQFSWSVFRFGPSFGVAWPDEQFPLEKVEELYHQEIPDENATLPSPNPTWANMATLARQLGGGVLVGHSESSSYPTRAALTDPTGVRGIIQLETGCLTTLTAAQIAILAKIPMLIVVGDHFSTPQPSVSCVTEMSQVNGAGGDMTFLSLPAAGLHGNSHMFMQDKNNLQVADVILAWIGEHVEDKKK